MWEMGLGNFNFKSDLHLLSQKTTSCDLGEALFALRNEISEGAQAQPPDGAACRCSQPGVVRVLHSTDTSLQQNEVLHWQRGWLEQGRWPCHHPVWCKAPFLCLHTALVQCWDHSGDRRGWSVNQWMALSSCFSCYRLLLLSLGTWVAVISYLEWKDFFSLELNIWEIWER